MLFKNLHTNRKLTLLYMSGRLFYNIKHPQSQGVKAMRKYCLFLYLFFFIVGGIAPLSASSSRYENNSFDNLKDYHILLTGLENGISTYSGVKDGLRLNFTVDSEQVTKIVFMFDNDVSATERRRIIGEIIDVSNNLLPRKIKSSGKAEGELYQKIDALKNDRDSDVFSLDRLRLEVNLNNHILNIRITP